MTQHIPEPLTNIGCQEMLAEEYNHSGWVRKRAFINKLGAVRWPRVYMVLANGCIYYFNNEYSKTPHGQFSLYGYSSVKRDKNVETNSAPFPFRIEHSNPEFKTYRFASSSEKEMKEWMKYIKGQMVTANGQTAETYYYTYRKAGKIIKEEAADDKSLTYQEIETDIYATTEFKPSDDYSSKFKVKYKDEESDDDDISNVPAPPPRIKKKDPRDRPPLPIPDEESTSIPVDAPGLLPRAAGSDDKPRKVKKGKQGSGENDDLQKELRNALNISKDKASGDPERSEKKGRRRKRKENRERSSEEMTNGADQEPVPQEVAPAPPKDAEDEDRYMRMKYVMRGSVEEEDEKRAKQQIDTEEEADEQEYWDAIYFNEDNKEKANEIIRFIGEDGVFLVRPGENKSQVLVVFADNMPKKYRIDQKNDEYSLSQTGPHAESVEMLLFIYHTEELPTAKVMLNLPYKLHEKYKAIAT